jgi:NDP-sugar pyrophosphorylase family protein
MHLHRTGRRKLEDLVSSTTIRQCAILVGGKGTRLGALTTTTPKPLLPCGDRPFLAWVMREMVRFGVRDFLLLTGHLSEKLRGCVPELARCLPPEVRIDCAEEPAGAGTGGALYHARRHLDGRFLLCNGDSLLDGNLARPLADAARDPPEAIGHMVLLRLPDASRFGVAEVMRDRVTAFHERPVRSGPGLINAGIYIFRRTIVERLAPVCSLERDVMPRLAADGLLCATEARGFFIDIGIPEDLRRAQEDLPARLRRPREGYFL